MHTYLLLARFYVNDIVSNPEELFDVLGGFEGDPYSELVVTQARDAVDAQGESELFVLDSKWAIAFCGLYGLLSP